MKHIFSILIISLIFYNSFGQNNNETNRYFIKGNVKQIFPLSAILPLQGEMLQLKNTSYNTVTDSSGDFIFNNIPRGKYIIHIVDLQKGFKDTIVNIDSESLDDIELVIISDCQVNSEIAEYDLKNGNPRLLIFGGISPIIYKGQKKFEKKYAIRYYDFGDVIPGEGCALDYNRKIFEYLDAKYGPKWRKEVRKDVLGL